MTLGRAAYVLAMRLLQSRLVLDDEERAALDYVLELAAEAARRDS